MFLFKNKEKKKQQKELKEQEQEELFKKLNAKVKPIVSNLAKCTAVRGAAVGYSGSRSEEYDLYEQLKNEATVEDLTLLLQHKSAVVRIYTIMALEPYFKENSLQMKPLDLIRKFEGDTEQVESQSGCMVYSTSASETASQELWPLVPKKDQDDYIKENIKKKNYSLRVVKDFIERIGTEEEYYPIFHELLEINISMLVKIAAFKKEQDVKLIASNLVANNNYYNNFYALRSVSVFPHPSFLPIIKEQYKKTDQYRVDVFYDAIIAYGLEETLDIVRYDLTRKPSESDLNKITSSIGHFIQKPSISLEGLRGLCISSIASKPNDISRLPEELATAVTQYSLLFKLCDILLEILQKYQSPNRNLLLYLSLSPSHYRRAAALLKSTKWRDAHDGSVVRDILVCLKDNFPLEFETFVNAAASESFVHTLPAALQFIVEMKYKSSIPILLSICEKETNPHMYGIAWIALFTYNDPEVDALAVKTFEKRCAKQKDFSANWSYSLLSAVIKEKPRVLRRFQ